MARDSRQQKILRIGIVQGGRIIEERLLRHREAITIGQSHKNKFMIPSPRVPISYRLVDVKGGSYILCFEKGMLGKVLVGEEVLDLKAIAMRKLATRKDDRFSFPLSEESRGKIVLGDVTLLFQFVTPPPEVPKLQLPAEARGAWWRNADRGMLVCFMLSLLMLGGSGGGLDVWWRQTGRYMAPAARKAPKIFQTLVTAAARAKEEEKKEDDGDKKAEKGIADAAEEEKKTSESSTEDKLGITEGDAPELASGGDDDIDMSDLTGDSAPGEGIDTDSMKDSMKDSFGSDEEKIKPGPLTHEQRMDRAKELVGSRTVVGLVGSEFAEGEGGGSDFLSNGMRRYGNKGMDGQLGLGDPGSGGSDYLDESDGIGDIADSVGVPGSTGGFGGPGIGGHGGTALAFKPEEIKAGDGVKTEAIAGTKKKLDVEKPKVVEKRWDVDLGGGGRGFVGKVDKAAVNKYLRTRSSAFQKCYAQVARRNPNVGGKLTLRIKIDMSGRGTAKVVSDGTGDPALAKCITEKIKEWTFPKPEGKAAEFTIPFVFRAL